MSDEITLTLPWKLAMHLKTLAHFERWSNPDCPPEMYAEWQAIIDAIDRQMLAAPAEGPERAATGETVLDWEDIHNAIAARLAADDARDAAIGGGGEG